MDYGTESPPKNWMQHTLFMDNDWPVNIFVIADNIKS